MASCPERCRVDTARAPRVATAPRSRRCRPQRWPEVPWSARASGTWWCSFFLLAGNRKATSLRYLTPMTDLALGFIGLGNVGGQLAQNLLRHGVNLTVRDLDPERVAALVARGAQAAASPRALAERV